MPYRPIAMVVFLFSCAVYMPTAPAQTAFPAGHWAEKSPADAGVDPAPLEKIAEILGGRGCVVKDGYVVAQ